MPMTYDLATDVGKVRLEVGDTVASAGVLPDGANLQDAEITYFLTREGTVLRAAAGVCEMLATRWAALSDLTVGPRKESLSQVSKAFAERAKNLRAQYGTAEQQAFSVGVVRVDGFSDDDPSDAVEQTGSEFAGSFVYVRPA